MFVYMVLIVMGKDFKGEEVDVGGSGVNNSREGGGVVGGGGGGRGEGGW